MQRDDDKPFTPKGCDAMDLLHSPPLLPRSVEPSTTTSLDWSTSPTRFTIPAGDSLHERTKPEGRQSYPVEESRSAPKQSNEISDDPVTVSVLINNHNYGRFVGRAIESVIAQEGAEAEVIVVDDGSTDDSASVLRGYGDRIEVVFQQNRGQAAAINAAVRVSHGTVLCFLDADDWWAPNKLARIVEAFRKDANVSLVYHRLQPMLMEDTPTLKPLPRSLCSGDLTQRLVGTAGWWPFPLTSAIAVRRRYWDMAGTIPEQFRISADSWLTGIYPFLGRVSALPEALGYYRIHNNSWFRHDDDAGMLHRRMVHWEATVGTINRYLNSRGRPEELSLADHHPYHVAAARLSGASLSRRLRLAANGFSFAGEPNLLRRVRDALRLLRDLPWTDQGARVRGLAQ
jgi:glycosyltransferase involved in cell wall biosynthesis